MLSAIKRRARSIVISLRQRYATRDLKVTGGPLLGRVLRFQTRREATWQREMISGTFDQWIFDRCQELNGVKVVWDIGAHIGYHSLAFAAILPPDSRVVAFEPNPSNLERIGCNFRLNPELASRICLMSIAVSDLDGTTSLKCGEDVDSGESSGSFIVDATPPLDKDTYKGYPERQVRCARGDSLISTNELPAPQLVKIDVEGAESLVLHGLTETLAKHRPELAIEIHNVRAMYDVLTQLNALSYGVGIVPNTEETPSRCFIWASPK